MMPRGKHGLVLAIYPQRRGFAFAAFEGWLAPVDWGLHDVRIANKNPECLRRVSRILALHAPDVVVLQDMTEHGTRRAPRIRELNGLIAEQAETQGVPVHAYSRNRVTECFRYYGGVTKQAIAETIAKHVPALNLYLPPVRKRWMNEHVRMSIFDAAALAWTFFHTLEGSREAA
jgi:Holliday junction resolvasome RuvABC endonuclease subunit